MSTSASAGFRGLDTALLPDRQATIGRRMQAQDLEGAFQFAVAELVHDSEASLPASPISADADLGMPVLRGQSIGFPALPEPDIDDDAPGFEPGDLLLFGGAMTAGHDARSDRVSGMFTEQMGGMTPSAGPPAENEGQMLLETERVSDLSDETLQSDVHTMAALLRPPAKTSVSEIEHPVEEPGQSAVRREEASPRPDLRNELPGSVKLQQTSKPTTTVWPSVMPLASREPPPELTSSQVTASKPVAPTAARAEGTSAQPALTGDPTVAAAPVLKAEHNSEPERIAVGTDAAAAAPVRTELPGATTRRQPRLPSAAGEVAPSAEGVVNEADVRKPGRVLVDPDIKSPAAPAADAPTEPGNRPTTGTVDRSSKEALLAQPEDDPVDRDPNQIRGDRAQGKPTFPVSVVESYQIPAFASPVTTLSKVVEAVSAQRSWAPVLLGTVSLPDTQSASGAPLKSLRIQLNPASLGTVDATLRLRGERLTVELRVESVEALRSLTEGQQTMLAALRDQGYGVDEISIQHTVVDRAANGAAWQDGGQSTGERAGHSHQGDTRQSGHGDQSKQGNSYGQSNNRSPSNGDPKPIAQGVDPLPDGAVYL